jgi:hypothetical protein
MGGMRRTVRLAVQRGWLGALIAAVLIAVLVEPRAQQGSSDEAQILAADASLDAAMRGGDKSIARRLLALQFSFVDENGKIHTRKDFLANLKGVAAATPATDLKVKVYGMVAMVTGHRKSAQGADAFFLDIWAKQKRAWRALTMQDVVLASADTSAADPPAPNQQPKADDCRNPCQTIPYRIRSPAEQDIVNAFQAMERAAVAHNADEWSRHVAEEFVDYRSDQAPVPKSERMTAIKDRKAAPESPTAIQSMRLWIYGDGAAMISTNVMPDDPEPVAQVSRVWVRRTGQWQLAISAQTAIKKP